MALCLVAVASSIAACAGVQFSFPLYDDTEPPPCFTQVSNDCVSFDERKALGIYLIRLQGELEKANNTIKRVNKG